MQRMQAKPPLGVVFDAHLGRTADDVLALGLLYGADGKNESRMLSVSLTHSNLGAAAFCDALGRIYLNASWGQAAQFFQPLPIGLSESGRFPEESPLLAAALSRTGPDGKPLYSHNVRKLTDTADPAPLVRNALSSQQDQNAVVVLSGPATNLARLLDLRGSKPLIESKVRLLSVATGAGNLKEDIAAARKLFAEWPGPIVATAPETGDSLLFPGSTMAANLDWTPNHPVLDAYRAWKAMPYDAPTANLAAALYAVRSTKAPFKLSEPGRIMVSESGTTTFVLDPKGRHRQISVDPEKKKDLITAYTQLVTAKPEVRSRRFRPMDDVDVEKPKPAATPQPKSN